MAQIESVSRRAAAQMTSAAMMRGRFPAPRKPGSHEHVTL